MELSATCGSWLPPPTYRMRNIMTQMIKKARNIPSVLAISVLKKFMSEGDCGYEKLVANCESEFLKGS
jgi:hypothetical protein